uniref:Uncharacterized protein n=1 Tax=Globisporangium ultimum (strain ATCC 200006 / CBS 805.95 / DAOM BR144) TaxID=431595 RepID=K3X0Y7_GLOUD
MFSFLARQYRWYKLEFGLTMLSWWEVGIFNGFALVVTSVTGYYLYNFAHSVVGLLQAQQA